MASVDSKSSIASDILLTKLAEILPKSATFKIYHLSTPPTKTTSLCSAPPNIRPDRTYRESHFLNISIQTPSSSTQPSQDVLVFAIEILIYSTQYDTTFFVSKADSTGYLHLLGLPKGTSSPIRSISSTFLRYLLEQHQRPGIRSVVSLFARAQDQYLYPGSVEYSKKHVLDDRGLIRWWCRVLDPLTDASSTSTSESWDTVKGYLIVPGLDKYETSSYPPRKTDGTKTWTIGHPLKQISRHGTDVPPRCLIPHYPDDPKARFLDELDEEITKGKDISSGQWKSMRTIDQFWEMMSFRQECSAGRLVGFIWIVFEPKSEATVTNSQTTVASNSQTWDASSTVNQIQSQNTSFNGSSQLDPTASPFKKQHREVKAATSSQNSSSKSNKTKSKKKLTGPIIPREPRIKTHRSSKISKIPENSPYYAWPLSGRGQVVVEETDYKRITELLLRLDFADLELATSSTERWVNEVQSSASPTETLAWGAEVTGTKANEIKSDASTTGTVSTLNVGLVRKKRKPEDVADESTTNVVPIVEAAKPAVNMLGAGMIRKKPKV